MSPIRKIRNLQIFDMLLFACFSILFSIPSQSYARDIDLAWDANHSNDNVVSYQVHYSKDRSGDPYDVTVDVGNVLAYAAVGLDNDGIYYCQYRVHLPMYTIRSA